MSSVYVGIGSNVGDRRGHLRFARQRLEALPDTRLSGFSRIYETAAVGPVEQGAYFNAAAALETSLSPEELLPLFSAIEAEAGRPDVMDRVKWGPRTLDLDMLLCDDQVISTDALIVPHPLMHDRWFVLRPLVDLNPGLVHPLLQMTVTDLLTHVESTASDDSGGFGHEVTVSP